jgi:hypothetical protein
MRQPGVALDPRWTLPSFAEKNPLVWMAEVNGLLVDLRHMPRDLQDSLHPSGSEGPILNATVAEEQYDDGGSVP